MKVRNFDFNELFDNPVKILDCKFDNENCVLRIKYNDILTHEDLEDIATDIFKDREKDMDVAIKYYEKNYGMEITLDIEDNFAREDRWFLNPNQKKIVKSSALSLVEQKLIFTFKYNNEEYATFRLL